MDKKKHEVKIIIAAAERMIRFLNDSMFMFYYKPVDIVVQIKLASYLKKEG
jgi:hypothetical protein